MSDKRKRRRAMERRLDRGQEKKRTPITFWTLVIVAVAVMALILARATRLL